MNGLSKSEMELLASASSSTSTTSTSPDSPPNTLKFGQKIYFEHVGPHHPKSATGSSSSPVTGTPAPTTSKKGRGGGVVQGRQPSRCQVEGCEADLSDVKAYYSRHKVCATHSKSPVVIVAGLEQRFCQQCSR